ncbi:MULTISPECIES: T9SS type A sorting domain-containing protein [Myroides]|uniref:LTD domain-containing protein n=1 Tax=Myroides odoratimimus CIP 101113 TaxID=883154 RepID=A0AAV3F4K7_9FLAO|nr:MULTISPECIES: T9SS type A sorting domain-containing protein [Myroides]APA92652.1 hypothetical protein BK054_10575 [Myroides sp. ZB35]EHO13612.1 hypothetical protein HMPREF9715_01150 [Myroides odoratimimus CIP 101113]SHL81120.1 Por secretion system C-terminal sorting domain-containing protein [Myroides odoratimimus subsp. xuanwuensis]
MRKITFLSIITFVILLFTINKTFGQIAITEVYYDTPFDEEFDLIRVTENGKKTIKYKQKAHHLGEFIELYNYTTSDISMDGWVLMDDEGAFEFPKNIVIKSGDFLVLAYRDLKNKPDIGNYFPIFFPTTKGKESKIIYQDAIILNNTGEVLTLYSSKFLDLDFKDPKFGYRSKNLIKVDQVSWLFKPTTSQRSPWSNAYQDTNYKVLGDRNFYAHNSLQLVADKKYSEIKATPFTSGYLPKIRSILDTPLANGFRINIANIDWGMHVQELVNYITKISISKVQQTPKGTFNKEQICFVYDSSGNMIGTKPCNVANKVSAMAMKNTQLHDQMTLDNLSIEEIKKHVIVYPNPTDGVFNVVFEKEIQGKIAEVEVFSMTGALVKSSIITKKDTSVSYDISNYPTGIYIVKFKLISNTSFNVNILKR